MALSRRVRDILAKEARIRSQDMALGIANEIRNKNEKRLRDAWKAIYPGSEDHRHVKASDIPGIAQRMMGIVGELREHFWDFRIAERTWQPPPNHHYELAAVFLAHACAGDETGLRVALRECEAILHHIADAHDELHSTFWSEARKDADGLPATPPISKSNLARALGDSYDKVHGDDRAGRWAPLERATRHQRKRRWRHVDPKVQRRALEQIREKYPEILWSEIQQ